MVAGSERWTLIAVLSAAAAMVVVDATVVNLALPTIAAALRMGSGLTQWVHEAYTLVFAALLLYCGQLGDRIGRRRMLVVGAFLLSVASALAAAAGGAGVLLAARALQGLGAAMIFPTTMSILSSSFQGRERATAFAVWGGTIGASAGVGAVLGGWLTSSLSWRAAFAMFVPVALVLAVAARRVIPENPGVGPVRRVDVVGTALSVVALGLAVLAVTQCPRWGVWTPGAEVAGWPVSPVPLLTTTAAIIGIVLIKRQRRYPKHRIRIPLDLSPLSIPSFRNGTFIAATVSLGEFGLMFALPFWWQNALGHSAADTAVLLLVPTVAALVAAGSGGVLVQRFGALMVVRVGLALEAAGLGGLAAVMSTSTSFGTGAVFMGVYGLGLGLASAQLGSLVLADVPEQSSGAASGTMNTAQQLGAAMGVAVLGLIMQTTLQADLPHRLAVLGTSADQATSIAGAVGDSTGGVIATLAAQPSTALVAEAARSSLTLGIAAAVSVAAFVLLSALVSTRALAASKAAGADSSTPRQVSTRERAAPTERLGYPRALAPAGWVAPSAPRVGHLGGRPISGARRYADSVTRYPVVDRSGTANQTA